MEERVIGINWIYVTDYDRIGEIVTLQVSLHTTEFIQVSCTIDGSECQEKSLCNRAFRNILCT